MRVIPIDEVRAWASQLAGEARYPDWLEYSYVVPAVLNDIALELVNTRRGLIGLVGQQGVGKSSALLALMKGKPFAIGGSRVLFKWRREKELFRSLLNFTHEATDDFIRPYCYVLVDALQSRFPVLGPIDAEEFSKVVNRLNQHFNARQDLSVSDISWVEAKLGKGAVQEIRRLVWLKVVRSTEVILIDTPDYSKTDKRRMDRDLEDIYWFWNELMSLGCVCTIVVAIQKEMFRDHFFLDKMKRFELTPLPAEKMVEAYRLRFESTYPFSEDALRALARMSRGVFRRFLRYISYTLDFWLKPARSDVIDEEAVRKAVPIEKLVEDMELELLGLFPKHSELRTTAVRLIMHLEQNGPQKQNQLAEEFDLESSTMSRLLAKLESAKFVTRTRDGVDKVVSLASH
jgi:GTPase SAR1 family protein